jgi:hypothetical protein
MRSHCLGMENGDMEIWTVLKRAVVSAFCWHTDKARERPFTSEVRSLLRACSVRSLTAFGGAAQLELVHLRNLNDNLKRVSSFGLPPPQH